MHVIYSIKRYHLKEKDILGRKDDRYLHIHESNIIVFAIISAIDRTNFYLSRTIIDEISLLDCGVYS